MINELVKDRNGYFLVEGLGLDSDTFPLLVHLLVLELLHDVAVEQVHVEADPDLPLAVVQFQLSFVFDLTLFLEVGQLLHHFIELLVHF